MPKFRITASTREQDWSKDNEPLQSQQSVAAAPTQSAAPDTPGFGSAQQCQLDTPGFGAAGDGHLSPLSD